MKCNEGILSKGCGNKVEIMTLQNADKGFRGKQIGSYYKSECDYGSVTPVNFDDLFKRFNSIKLRFFNFIFKKPKTRLKLMIRKCL